jgi:hypothetical protein
MATCLPAQRGEVAHLGRIQAQRRALNAQAALRQGQQCSQELHQPAHARLLLGL